jgi:hypothetical protein
MKRKPKKSFRDQVIDAVCKGLAPATGGSAGNILREFLDRRRGSVVVKKPETDIAHE